MSRETIFSPCRKYRYTLWRSWPIVPGLNSRHYVQFIGLNPSTADETQDDPTIRRCKAFAKAWGYSAMCMTNLFAWRDTDPLEMKRTADPIGPDNNKWLLEVASGASIIIAAWGKHGSYLYRGARVKQFIPNLKCLRKNKDGSPEHPLYLPSNLTPIEL